MHTYNDKGKRERVQIPTNVCKRRTTESNDKVFFGSEGNTVWGRATLRTRISQDIVRSSQLRRSYGNLELAPCETEGTSTRKADPFRCTLGVESRRSRELSAVFDAT